MTQAETKARAKELFDEHCLAVWRRTDRMFAYLLVAQWVVAIAFAFGVSPYTWAGKVRSINVHVPAALILGGALTLMPLFLIWKRPGARLTRMTVAVAQMLWSALFIHLTGGRIETHFHVFGSLAFLAFYGEWLVLVPATLVVALDHLVRQLFWPESVYGMVDPEWWRFLEHAFWVVFEDTVLIMWCLWTQQEMRRGAEVRAELELSREVMVRSEKLAAIGQLAASVGHELRNPLAAVRSASAFIAKKVKATPALEGDARLAQMMGVVDQELSASFKIISDLLDFARERPPTRAPCPLRPLVDDAVGVIAQPTTGRVINDVPPELPIPNLDRDQFRQLLTNLIQNGVEAVASQENGKVTVKARGGNGEPWTISVSDNGPGIPDDTRRKLFEPLFTTKTKGTGLGLAISASIVRRHGGSIRVDSQPASATTFTIELPPEAPAKLEERRVA